MFNKWIKTLAISLLLGVTVSVSSVFATWKYQEGPANNGKKDQNVNISEFDYSDEPNIIELSPKEEKVIELFLTSNKPYGLNKKSSKLLNYLNEIYDDGETVFGGNDYTINLIVFNSFYKNNGLSKNTTFMFELFDENDTGSRIDKICLYTAPDSIVFDDTGNLSTQYSTGSYIYPVNKTTLVLENGSFVRKSSYHGSAKVYQYNTRLDGSKSFRTYDIKTWVYGDKR